MQKILQKLAYLGFAYLYKWFILIGYMDQAQDEYSDKDCILNLSTVSATSKDDGYFSRNGESFQEEQNEQLNSTLKEKPQVKI